MNRNQKIVLFSGIGIVVILVAFVLVIIINSSRHDEEINRAERAEALADSLRLANDQMALTNEFNQINADFSAYEGQQIYLKNDSLVSQYNAARQRIENLLSQLNKEKKSNEQSRQHIKELEAEVATLKDICRHYLEEIQRLGKENEGLREEIAQVSQKNQELTSQVTTATTQNEALTRKVQLAEKLNVTGVSLSAYNKKGKTENNITKARKLGVSFTISPNNTAAPGMKEVYLRIISPEGSLLGSGGSFKYDGTTLASTAHRSVEYANDELSTAIYWDVNTTLTPGEYTIELFCDGNRLTSRRFTMKK